MPQPLLQHTGSGESSITSNTPSCLWVWLGNQAQTGPIMECCISSIPVYNNQKGTVIFRPVGRGTHMRIQFHTFFSE
jgi:hypothetical protein